jgi:hypothetical protein
VQLSDNHWQASIQEAGTAIYLKYVGAGSGTSFDVAANTVPEPSTIVLVGLFASMSLVSRPARCRKRLN